MFKKLFFKFFIRCFLGMILFLAAFSFFIFFSSEKSINLIDYSLWGLLIAFFLSIITSLFITLYVKAPLNQITQRAQEFETGEIIEGIDIDKIKCKEFKELLKAVNKMGYFMTESVQRMNSDKNKLEIILENINKGIITFDYEQNPIQINSAAKNMLLLDDENIKFDTFFEDLGIDVKMAEFSYLDKSKEIEKKIEKMGRLISIWLIPFKIDSERMGGVVCIFEDITEQTNVMEAMRKFVVDVSHELRTPLTTISLNTETVLNNYLDDKVMAENLLTVVYQETGKMTDLIQNLLDISKMKAVKRKKENFSVDELIQNLVNTFKVEVEKKKLSLSYNRMTEIPEFKGNRNDIERALKNIISNSIKYTSKGDEIRIFAGKMNNEIYIKIEDTGWGIPENKIGRLFERFYRVEESRTREKGGTGLGLAISKEIIENHGGKIKIESEYTKYTRVTITLPLPL